MHIFMYIFTGYLFFSFQHSCRHSNAWITTPAADRTNAGYWLKNSMPIASILFDDAMPLNMRKRKLGDKGSSGSKWRKQRGRN